MDTNSTTMVEVILPHVPLEAFLSIYIIYMNIQDQFAPAAHTLGWYSYICIYQYSTPVTHWFDSYVYTSISNPVTHWFDSYMYIPAFLTQWHTGLIAMYIHAPVF